MDAISIHADPHRPTFHFLPPRNWMNDPNGLLHFRGRYHLFYQHNPHGPAWDAMHWGHAVSNDLIHWRHLPPALKPGPEPYDQGGVFSGCAVVHEGKPTLVYTGVRPECQCLATPAGGEDDPDLVHWVKHPANPVIAAPPAHLATTDFRDPCVWREGDDWLMAVGSSVNDPARPRGLVLLYRSTDLVHWESLHPLAEGDGALGTVWECPNFFPLGDRHVLILSPIPLARAIYFVGRWKDRHFAVDTQGEIDLGGALYAPQVLREEGGRMFLFGWLWERRSKEAGIAAGWQGVQTLPRELSLGSDGHLRYRPAVAVERLRRQSVAMPPLLLAPESVHSLHPLAGDALDLDVVVEPGGSEEVNLLVRASPDGSEVTRVGYRPREGRLRLDTTRASLDSQTHRDIRESPLELETDEALHLRVLVDRSVIEVFANERVCLAGRVYPTRPDARGVALSSRGGAAHCPSVRGWRMAAVWE